MSSTFKLQPNTYSSLQRTLISVKKIKSIPGKKGNPFTSKATCRDTIQIVLPQIPEKRLSLSPNEIEDLISTLISIFFSCLSPDFLHYLLFPNIVHLSSLWCLSSLYIKHSRLFHPKITKQYKQKKKTLHLTQFITLQKFQMLSIFNFCLLKSYAFFVFHPITLFKDSLTTKLNGFFQS